jgi:hypothetical protein
MYFTPADCSGEHRPVRQLHVKPVLDESGSTDHRIAWRCHLAAVHALREGRKLRRPGHDLLADSPEEHALTA